jgi:hypothetical protein
MLYFKTGRYSCESSSATFSVADPDPGCGAFFDPRLRDGKKSGSGINIPNQISKSLATIFWLKNT